MSIFIDFYNNRINKATSISKVYSIPGSNDIYSGIYLSGVQDGFNKNFTINGLSGIGYVSILTLDGFLQIINQDYTWNINQIVFNIAPQPQNVLSIQITNRYSYDDILSWGSPISNSYYSLEEYGMRLNVSFTKIEPGENKLSVEFYIGNDLFKEILTVPFYDGYNIQPNDLNYFNTIFTNKINSENDDSGRYVISYSRDRYPDCIQQITKYKSDNISEVLDINHDYDGYISNIHEVVYNESLPLKKEDLFIQRDKNDNELISKIVITNENSNFNLSLLWESTDIVSFDYDSHFYPIYNDDNYIYGIYSVDNNNWKIWRNGYNDNVETIYDLNASILSNWVIDDNYIYLLISNIGDSNSRYIKRINKDGSGLITLGSIPDNRHASCMKVIDNYIYMINTIDVGLPFTVNLEYVSRFIKTDCSGFEDIKVFNSISRKYGTIPFYHIISDINYIYFLRINSNNSELYKIDKTDMSTELMVSGLYNPVNLLLDGDYIYITEYNSFNLIKINKNNNEITNVLETYLPKIILKNNNDIFLLSDGEYSLRQYSNNIFYNINTDINGVNFFIKEINGELKIFNIGSLAIQILRYVG